MAFTQIKEHMESELGLVTPEQIGGRNALAGYSRHGFQMTTSVIELDINFIVFDFGREAVTAMSTEQCLDAAFRFALKRHKQFYPRWSDFARLIPVGVVSLIVSFAPQRDAISYCRDLKCQRVWLRPKVPVIVDASSAEPYYFRRSPRRGSWYYTYIRELVSKITQHPLGDVQAHA